MLPNVAYYGIDSYPLFFIKIHTTQIDAFRAHCSSSWALQYNCTTDYQALFLLSEKLIFFHYIATSTRKVTVISAIVRGHFLFSTRFGRKRHVSRDLN